MPDPRLTPLHDRHEGLGASFTDFGGWSMPVRYTSDLAEHHAVRTTAGLFDISHMAEFFVRGERADEFLDYALAGRLSTLVPDQAKYTLLLDVAGGIIDDLIVYRGDGQFLIVANAGNRDAVAEALRERSAGFDIEIDDATDRIALIAVQGPAAQAIVEATEGITGLDAPLDQLRYYRMTHGEFAPGGRDGVLLGVGRTGYTGEDGFELFLEDVSAAGALWDALLSAGEPYGLVPAGLAARDTLRLEAGMPLYGHELSLDMRPAQAGLGRVVAADKADFVGKDGVEPPADAPVLVGLVADGKRAGRAGYPVLSGDDVVGEITSGALSPTLGHPIAMAFVSPSASAPGTQLTIDVRGTRIPATVTALPFYRRTK
ncbi:glycine cleavage system aminomethyltransferase GcvT [Microbacterium sp. SS28]|uniref:glycine cleavage system aminomethyltransferase GcvT n=1 Tax=Microbacterium sp. SS28 TaxID=2919948 RepID=UPI001FAA57B3|nr:glycine cleavage system aminomethyltransferase GcvT [Microbacterium sp. SS28]